eukprot:364197-Chlamydomonas_euryale.AAC.21
MASGAGGTSWRPALGLRLVQLGRAWSPTVPRAVAFAVAASRLQLDSLHGARLLELGEVALGFLEHFGRVDVLRCAWRRRVFRSRGGGRGRSGGSCWRLA